MSTYPAARVLVIDDHHGSAIGIATYLALAGMEARTAGGCGDALEAIHNWMPDVVLLDIRMPQRDGFSTAEAIWNCTPDKRPYLLAFTAADRQFVMNNPASRYLDGYCRKGTSPATLVSLVLDIVGHSADPRLTTSEGSVEQQKILNHA
ncbi:response regulator [Burkholderia sp. Ac-20365]|uniref:response regulator n=1 Tax=Burkholderia sp. Ac-20365 TaxID=2703897 RepID=UPI00197B75F6|nr:response regulator [Burkholderia sp. Ac-20365]MBN3760546.1 response regulator transcription factor [Burkholderia sp. Ac-20365]